MVTKKLKEINKIIIDQNKNHEISQAIDLLKKVPKAKFDESIEIAMNLNIDVKKSDQNIRGVINLPHGNGKNVRVAVFVKEDKADEAKKAGADIIGEEDLIEKIKSGFLDFDRCIATPNMMPQIGKISRILGPKGLMPNPKLGTVTENIADAIKSVKSGQVEYHSEKSGIIHASVAKISFSNDQIIENINAFISHIKKIKPSSVKGVFVKNIAISSTMGPGIKIQNAS